MRTHLDAARLRRWEDTARRARRLLIDDPRLLVEPWDLYQALLDVVCEAHVWADELERDAADAKGGAA